MSTPHDDERENLGHVPQTVSPSAEGERAISQPASPNTGGMDARECQSPNDRSSVDQRKHEASSSVYEEPFNTWIGYAPGYREAVIALEIEQVDRDADDGQDLAKSPGQAERRASTGTDDDDDGDEDEDDDEYDNDYDSDDGDSDEDDEVEDDDDDREWHPSSLLRGVEVDEEGADEALEALLGPLASIYGLTAADFTTALEAGTTNSRRRPTRGQLVALLRDPELTRLFVNGDREFEDGSHNGFAFINETAEALRDRERRRRPDPNRFPKVPSEAGQKLMQEGVFGYTNIRKNLTRLLLDRELAVGSTYDRARVENLLTQHMIPRNTADTIIHYDAPLYSGQFSKNGNFFFSACQDYKIRLYDTSDPYNWKHYKTFTLDQAQWTITDASLDPTNKFLAYSSISQHVAIAPTSPEDKGEPYLLDFSGRDPTAPDGFMHFAVWSLRFSGDGRELVGGTTDHEIVVYDVESRRILHKVRGHRDDVNAVCFATAKSPHIIYSGSDDTTIKIWDRRSMGDSREVGAFAGHCHGVTFIESREDNRYILSNGKDQCMKLWDVRMAMSTVRFDEVDPTRRIRWNDFDYRHHTWDEKMYRPQQWDNSLVTFRGHRVLKTLIRCHFSPETSTGGRYVYTGSADGKVYIYNLDATIAKVIDVQKATRATRPLDRRIRRVYHDVPPNQWATIVRDASWHPYAPVIAASAWNGWSMARGTCTTHSWSETPMDDTLPFGKSVDEKLRPRRDLHDKSQPID